MGQRELISQGVLSYGKHVKLNMLWTFALKICFKKCPGLINCCIPTCQADFADHLKLFEKWKYICSDMVGVISLIHRLMLKYHYNREFELQRSDGWTDDKHCFPLFSLRPLNTQIESLYYWLMTCICALGMLLCLLFRSASKEPANEKKERPLSTMSEVSNYTDHAANPSSPAGRVSDTHNQGQDNHTYLLTWGSNEKTTGSYFIAFKLFRKNRFYVDCSFFVYL